MTPQDWNLIAEVLGFASGACLLWPAVTMNYTLRRAFKLKRLVAGGKSKLGAVVTEAPAVTDAGRPQWTALDQWLLTAGAVTLSVSFGIKVYVALQPA